MDKDIKTGSGCLTIFGSLFFLVGLGIFLWGLVAVYQSWQASDWEPVEATIVQVEQIISHGDDSTTYGVEGSFSYQYQGVNYQSTQLSFNSGTDNIGHYQMDFYQTLSDHFRHEKTITAYVNPDNPSEAVIDRGVRWGMLGFQSIFLVVFGGVGLGIMVLARFSKKKAIKQQAFQQQNPEQPWRWKPEWQSEVIGSNNQAGFYGILFFAVIWNAISIPSAILGMIEFFETYDWPILLVLLFPLVGIGLITASIILYKRWKKFGNCTVQLQEFPLAIGAVNKGHIVIPKSLPSDAKVLLTLTCKEQIQTGSGKNKSTRTNVLWQTDQRVNPVAIDGEAHELPFTFNIPEGLPEYNDDNHRHKLLWELTAESALPGVDLNNNFLIPAFEISERKKTPADEFDLFAEEDAADDAIDSFADRGAGGSWENLGLQHSVTNQGNNYYFPALRNKGLSIGLIIFGLIFAAVGLGSTMAGAPMIFLIIFGGLGILITIWGFRMATFRSNLVATGGSLYVKKGHIFLGSEKEIMRNDIKRIYSDSNMSQNNRKIYQVMLELTNGDKLVLAKNLMVKSDVDSFIEQLKNDLGWR